ncbi:MAG TPA: hypothetical protein VJB37_03215 [Patescibacteria group bacterium]|nr:hypothetical protein [Patescibacteria group bacterium]
MIELKPGCRFEVDFDPKDAYQRVDHRKPREGEVAETPLVFRLILGSKGLYEVKERHAHGRGKALFVPADLKRGDSLEIQWVDARCTRAVRCESTPCLK